MFRIKTSLQKNPDQAKRNPTKCEAGWKEIFQLMTNLRVLSAGKQQKPSDELVSWVVENSRIEHFELAVLFS